MPQPFLHYRLTLLTLLVALCSLWVSAGAMSAAFRRGPGHFSQAQALAIRATTADFDRHGATDHVARHSGEEQLGVRVSLDDGRGGRVPVAAEVRVWEDRDISLTLGDTSTTDNSDESDAAAHIESRAGPSVVQPSRPLLGILDASPRFRSHSSSTPRAPPAALRLV